MFRSPREMYEIFTKSKPSESGITSYSVDQMPFEDLKRVLRNRGEDVDALIDNLNKTSATKLLKTCMKTHLEGVKAAPVQILGNPENFNHPVLRHYQISPELMHPVGDQVEKVIALGRNVLKPGHRGSNAKAQATADFSHDLEMGYSYLS